MITGNVICLGPIGADSAQTYFVQVPFACQVTTVRATAQNSDIGDADTVTISDGIGGNDIGEALFGSDIAAGAKATYTPDATYGDQDLEKNDIIQVVVSALDASGDRVFVEIELDPHALS